MKEINDLTLKLIETLAEPNLSPEQKKLRALIKTAHLSDNLLAFANEVRIAFTGLGKVDTDTVKGAVEYARAHNEAQIRSMTLPDEELDRLVQQENNRLTEVQIMILGALAHWGLLK